MVKLTMCRICLVKNVKMYSMENTNLQVLYKILAAMPFHTQDGRPLQVCYICRAILMKCYRLRVNCLRSEAWFTQILAKKGSNDVPLHNIHKLKIHHPVLRLRLEPEFMETTQNTPEGEDEPVVKKRKLIYKESAENIIPRNPAKDNMDSYNSEQWENSCKVSFLSWKDKNEEVKQSQDCSSTKLIETNAGNIKLENLQIKQEYTEEDTELDNLYIEQDINDFDEGTTVLGGKVLTKQEGEAISEVDNLPVKPDQIDVKKEYDEIEYLSVKQKEMVTVHDIELQYLVKQENSNNSNVNQNEVNFEEDLDEPENFGLEIENVTKPEMSLEISTQNGGKTLENTGSRSNIDNVHVAHGSHGRRGGRKRHGTPNLGGNDNSIVERNEYPSGSPGALAEDLLKSNRLIYLTMEPRSPTTLTTATITVQPRPNLESNRPKLEHRHFPVRTGFKRSRCWMCAKRKVNARTIWKCLECNTNLCIESCFMEYHT